MNRLNQNQPGGLTELQAQIFREARSRRPVPHLMAWLLDRRNLEAAWSRVRSADGAGTPGPDGVTCGSVDGQVGPWLAGLADELYQQNYAPAPPRVVEIPKPNKPGGARKLGILNVRDRVVSAALKQALEPILEPQFVDTSYGFRPGRSVAAALVAAVRSVAGPAESPTPAFTHAAHIDVADCFDTIDHSLLLRELAHHVIDPVVLQLVGAILQAGGRRAGTLWWQRARGVVQGSPLSPLLCNLALHPADVALRELGRATKGGVLTFRYADDLLVLGRDRRLADQGVALARTQLGKLHLRPGRGRPQAVPLKDGVEWLGVRLQPLPGYPGRPARFGYAVPPAKVGSMLERLTAMTAPPSDKIDGSAFNIARWIVSVNEQLRDWRQSYLYAANAPDVFGVLDDHARERVGELIRAITGARGPDLYREYKARLARGFWTWEVSGARLTVLSSLAPHAPAYLVQKPAWMKSDVGGALPAPSPLALPAPRTAPGGQ